MKNLKAIFLILVSISLFSACNLNNQSEGESALIEQINETVLLESRLDTRVEIDESTKFSDMTESEKESSYAILDEIDRDTASDFPAQNYSMITEIESEEDYINFILSTNEEAKVIYLGFNECPYCLAFAPKINQLASEFEVPIYYYNTRKRANDGNFMDAMANYEVNTVPYAFIVENGEPIESINHNSSMNAIEAFITYANNL